MPEYLEQGSQLAHRSHFPLSSTPLPTLVVALTSSTVTRGMAYYLPRAHAKSSANPSCAAGRRGCMACRLVLEVVRGVGMDDAVGQGSSGSCYYVCVSHGLCPSA